MLNVGALKEGYVLDHIKAGKAMTIYHDLKLDKLDCTVAIIKNARSNKMGKKDIIKVECPLGDVDLDILGFIDHNITVNIIKDSKIVDKKELKLPKQVVNVIKCKTLAVLLLSNRNLIISSFLQMKKKKFTDANTAMRSTEENAINNKSNQKQNPAHHTTGEPGSVFIHLFFIYSPLYAIRPISRVMSLGNHLSRPFVARGLKRPT